MTKGELELLSRLRVANVPRAVRGETIILATWNVRELGRSPRRDDSIRMIAKILSSFSLVSLVELRRETGDLERILEVLGKHWRALYSDPLEDPGANEERACFVFDTRYVQPTGLVTVVHGRRRRIGDEYVTPHWWRPPYLASFRAGALDFLFATAHVRWNAAKGGRLAELRALAEWADRRAQRSATPTALVLAGDMNIPDTVGPLYRALVSKGLAVPRALLGSHGTNLAANKRYDQILHLPVLGERFTQRAGVVDFYANDLEALFPRLTVRRDDLTREISDHLPLWAELSVR